jgi:hypothetical protein
MDFLAWKGIFGFSLQKGNVKFGSWIHGIRSHWEGSWSSQGRRWRKPRFQSLAEASETRL